MAVKYEAEPPVFSFKLVFIKAFLEARHFSMHHGGRKRNEALSFPSGDLKNHAHKQNCSEKQKLGGRFDQREGWGMGWAQAQVQSRGSGVVGGGGSH